MMRALGACRDFSSDINLVASESNVRDADVSIQPIFGCRTSDIPQAWLATLVSHPSPVVVRGSSPEVMALLVAWLLVLDMIADALLELSCRPIDTPALRPPGVAAGQFALDTAF
uniref:Polyketide synthase n=1 Tax=Peronospora matthiolae TaxID=2874970 RepID=A0AAV1U1M8_9STRA